MRCPACHNVTWHRTEWRGEGGPSNPTKGSGHALAVNAAVWVGLVLLALHTALIIGIVNDGLLFPWVLMFGCVELAVVPLVVAFFRGSWLRAFAWSAFILAVPCMLLAGFFAYAMATESGGWHPHPAEAMVVSVAWVGSVMFPIAGVVLWRGQRLAGQRRGWAVLVMTILIFVLVAMGGVKLSSLPQVPQAVQVQWLKNKLADLIEAMRKTSDAKLGETIENMIVSSNDSQHTLKPSHPVAKEVDKQLQVAIAERERRRTSAKETTTGDKISRAFDPGPPQINRESFEPDNSSPTTSIQGTMNDDDVKKLSWQQFAETPGKYWRELADVRRFGDAAMLIERYLELHPDLAAADASGLHFHAGQCRALQMGGLEGTKKEACLASAIKHLQQSASHVPSSGEQGRLWRAYLLGTVAFLTGNREDLMVAHEELAKGDPINKHNLCVLDRLLANFGKSYVEGYETEGQDHKKLSADCFNRAWELLDKEGRTKEENERMISLAHASLAHWRMREDCTDQNLSIGYWQIARVYAVLGQGANACRYGELCLRVSGKEPPFYLAYAHEALARAALLNRQRDAFDRHLSEAKALAAKLTDADEKKLIQDDLDSLQWTVQ